MKPFSRSDRVGGQIQKVLSELLHKGIKDPRLKMTSISSVKVSADLKYARIYFITSGDVKRRQEAADGFNKAMGYLKRELARQLGLRYMPELKFFYDDSFDYGTRIDKILNSLNTDHESNHTAVEE
ncbi:MAG: 30S ribosome-binding factor RbfA [Thermodesulfobacteriota bacterium]